MLESRINSRSLGIEVEAVCPFLGLAGTAKFSSRWRTFFAPMV